MPSSGALPSFRSSSLSHEYTELEELCFLALLLLFSSVMLSISQTPLASSYSLSFLVPLMTSRYVPPIRKKEEGGAEDVFKIVFSHRNLGQKKNNIRTLHNPYNLIMNFLFSCHPPFKLWYTAASSSRLLNSLNCSLHARSICHVQTKLRGFPLNDATHVVDYCSARSDINHAGSTDPNLILRQ